MSNPTVKQIVTDYLKDNGYDGLYSEDRECGCKLDDPRPCGEYYLVDCRAGYEYKRRRQNTNFDGFIGPDKVKSEAPNVRTLAQDKADE